MPSSLSLILPIAIVVSVGTLIYVFQRDEFESPLLPTNQRPYSGYTEPRPDHSPVETPSPTPHGIPSSTPRSESLADPNAFTSQPQHFPDLRTPPPPSPPPSPVRKPQQYSFSRDNFPGTSIEQVHRPATKAPIQKIIEPPPDPVYQPPMLEPSFGARKPQQYSFSWNDLPGPLIEPVHQSATKAPVRTQPLDSVYQPPEPEALFGTRKPQQYSFSRDDLPRTPIEPVLKTPPLDQPPSPEPLFGARKPQQYSFSRDDLPRTPIEPVPKTTPLDRSPSPEPLFGARKPQQYSFSRNDLPRTSIDQVHGPATGALVQNIVDPSLDSGCQPSPTEAPFGVRKPQQYSFVRNDLPGPLIENIYRPTVKTTVQKTGTVIDGEGGDDDDIKDLDHLELRDLANQEMENMKKCRTDEKLAKRYRQLILAKELAVKGQRHEKRMRELNDRASKVVFAKNNKDPELRKIDLHGLTVKEAIGHTNRVLKEARELGNSEIRIIVGKGKHSKDGLSKLKPAIQAYLEENRFPVEADPRNDGVFVVGLDSALGS